MQSLLSLKKQVSRMTPERVYQLLFGLTVLFVLRSRPFLKLPYDMWHHLMVIRGWFQDGAPVISRPGVERHEAIWHWLWAKVFLFFGIDNVFVWAKVIHCCQFFWTLFGVNYFASTCLRLVMPELPTSYRKIASLAAAWLFVSCNGTPSVEYQLSWILWYSLTYQSFAMPLYFLGVAFILEILADQNLGRRQIQLRALLLVLGTLAIFLTHPLEAGYLLIQLVFLAVFFFDGMKRIFRLWPKMSGMVLLGLLLSPSLLYILPEFGVDLPRSHAMDILHQPLALWQRFFEIGAMIQRDKLHRGLGAVNELYLVGVALLGFAAAYYLKTHSSSRVLRSMHLRVLLWLFFSALFFALIPHIEFTAGFFGALTHHEQVWRFVLAGPWFMGVVLVSSSVAMRKGGAQGVMAGGMILLFALGLSRFVLHGPLNTNIASTFRSLELRSKDSVSVQFDRQRLEELEAMMHQIREPMNGKKVIVLIPGRADLQVYVRAATGRYVVGGRFQPATIERFNEIPESERQNLELVIVKMPQDFPFDEDIQKAFSQMDLRIVP